MQSRPTLPDLRIETVPLADLRPHARNARRHNKKQVRQLARSIEAFGFTNPILVSSDLQILAGHGRVGFDLDRHRRAVDARLCKS